MSFTPHSIEVPFLPCIPIDKSSFTVRITFGLEMNGNGKSNHNTLPSKILSMPSSRFRWAMAQPPLELQQANKDKKCNKKDGNSCLVFCIFNSRGKRPWMLCPFRIWIKPRGKVGNLFLIFYKLLTKEFF